MKLSCVRWFNWWEIKSPESAITDNLHCCAFKRTPLTCYSMLTRECVCLHSTSDVFVGTKYLIKKKRRKVGESGTIYFSCRLQNCWVASQSYERKTKIDVRYHKLKRWNQTAGFQRQEKCLPVLQSPVCPAGEWHKLFIFLHMPVFFCCVFLTLLHSTVSCWNIPDFSDIPPDLCWKNTQSWIFTKGFSQCLVSLQVRILHWMLLQSKK